MSKDFKDSKKKTIKQELSSKITPKTITTDIEKCITAGYENILNIYGLSIVKGNPIDLSKLCKERKVSLLKLKNYYFEKTGNRLQKINYNEKSKEGILKYYEKVKKAKIAYNNNSATKEQTQLIANELQRVKKIKETREFNKTKKLIINSKKVSNMKGGALTDLEEDSLNDTFSSLDIFDKNLNASNESLNELKKRAGIQT